MSAPRLVCAVTLPVLIVLIACSDGPVSPMDQASPATPPDPVFFSAPSAVPFVGVLHFINPCSGLNDTATITGTLWIHERDGRLVVRSKSTIVTSSGFQGGRTRTIVVNGNNFKVSLNAMLTNDAGQRIRIHFVQIVDLSTGTVRVQKGGGPTCVGG